MLATTVVIPAMPHDQSQAPIATPGDHAVNQGEKDPADVWTPRRLAKAECGAGHPIPANPAVLMYPEVAAESKGHHYNVDVLGIKSPIDPQKTRAMGMNSPLFIGGINVFDSASPPTRGEMRTGPSTGSSEWRDASLGNSGFRPMSLSQEYGEIIPVSLDFSPGEKSMDFENGVQSTASPASSPNINMGKKREFVPATATESGTAKKKAKVQDWLNKNFVNVSVKCDFGGGCTDDHHDLNVVSGGSAGSSHTVHVQASSGGTRTMLDYFRKKSRYMSTTLTLNQINVLKL